MNVSVSIGLALEMKAYSGAHSSDRESTPGLSDEQENGLIGTGPEYSRSDGLDVGRSTGFQVADEDVPLLMLKDPAHAGGEYGNEWRARQLPTIQHASRNQSPSFAFPTDFGDEKSTRNANAQYAELLVDLVANIHEFSDPDNEVGNSSISETFFDLTRPRLIAIFNIFDEASVDKGKGILSYDHFKSCLNNVGLEIKDKASFMRLVSNVDLDRDEGITFTEFETVVQSLKMAHMFRNPPVWENFLKCVNYNNGKVRTDTVAISDLKSFMHSPRPEWATNRWIEVHLPASFTLKCLSIKYRLHPLALEDVLNDSSKARAKIEHFSNHIFVVFPVLALDYGDEDHVDDAVISSEGLSLRNQAPFSTSEYGSLGPRQQLIRGGTDLDSDGLPKTRKEKSSSDLETINVPRVVKSNAYIFVSLPDQRTTLCALSDQYPDLFRRIHRELNVSYSRLRQQDGMFLLYVLTDCIADSYMPLIAEFERNLENLSKQVRSKRQMRISGDWKKHFLDAFHDLDREVNNFRRWILPAQRVVTNLINNELIEKDCKSYLQDVRDHLEQLIDDISSLLRNLHALKEEHNHSLNLRMNQTMHMLTIVTAVALPSQLMSSVYGMNFKFMPFVNDPYGFAFFWIFVFVSWFVLYRYFKYTGHL